MGKWHKRQRSNVKIPPNNMEISFFKNLKKIGYRYFNIYKRNHTDKKVIKIFQQHYLPKNVSGRIDRKTFIVSQLLI